MTKLLYTTENLKLLTLRCEKYHCVPNSVYNFSVIFYDILGTLLTGMFYSINKNIRIKDEQMRLNTKLQVSEMKSDWCD